MEIMNPDSFSLLDCKDTLDFFRDVWHPACFRSFVLQALKGNSNNQLMSPN